MTAQQIISALNDLVEQFAREEDALDTVRAENRKTAAWLVTLRLSRVEFVYTKKETTACPFGTLFCRVYLEKNKPIPYQIPELVELLGLEEFFCYYFPYVCDREYLLDAFSSLCGFFRRNREALHHLALSAEQARTAKVQAMEHLFKLDFTKFTPDPVENLEKESYWLTHYDAQLVNLFTTGKAHRALMEGDREKALSLFSKQGNLLPYEQRLVSYLQDNAVPAEAASIPRARALSVQKASSKTDFLGLLVAMFLGMAAFVVPFVLAAVIANSLLSRGAVYADLMPPLLAGVFGALPGVFFGIGFMDKAGEWFSKDRAAVKQYHALTFSPALRRFVMVFSCIVLAAVLVLFGGIIRPPLRAYNDRFDYRDADNPFSAYRTVTPEEVETVYFVDGLYNDFGDFIDRDYYVIVLADGTQISTDGFSDQQAVTRDWLALLNKTPIPVDSDRALP